LYLNFILPLSSYSELMRAVYISLAEEETVTHGRKPCPVLHLPSRF